MHPLCEITPTTVVPEERILHKKIEPFFYWLGGFLECGVQSCSHLCTTSTLNVWFSKISGGRAYQ